MPDGTKKSAFSMTWRRLAKNALIKTLARVAGKNKRDSAGATRAGLLTAIVAVLASPAFADAPPRVRGVVIGVDDGSITIKEGDGGVITLKKCLDNAARTRSASRSHFYEIAISSRATNGSAGTLRLFSLIWE